jgi:hypothetical protein
VVKIAIEAYMVAFDIQEGGSGYGAVNKALFGAKSEASVGPRTFEGSGTTTSASLQGQGILSNVANCKLTEVFASSAAEAVEAVRIAYAQNSGGERAVVKPNETNFKVIV